MLCTKTWHWVRCEHSQYESQQVLKTRRPERGQSSQCTIILMSSRWYFSVSVVRFDNLLATLEPDDQKWTIIICWLVFPEHQLSVCLRRTHHIRKGSEKKKPDELCTCSEEMTKDVFLNDLQFWTKISELLCEGLKSTESRISSSYCSRTELPCWDSLAFILNGESDRSLFCPIIITVNCLTTEL